MHIITILDRSWSMSKNKVATIDGLNAYIREQQLIDDGALFTLVMFSTSHDIVIDSVPLKQVTPVSHDAYVCNDCTALYDTIKFVLTRYPTDSSTIVVIVTDGNDNGSETPLSTVKDLIEEKKSVGWNFIYLCNDLEVAETGTQMGVTADGMNTNNLSVGSDDIGITLSRQVSAVTSAYRRSTNRMSDVGSSESSRAREINMPDHYSPENAHC